MPGRCKATPLADLLLERGWINSTDRDDVDRLLERKLKKHKSLQASLASVAGRSVRGMLAAMPDEAVQHSLAELPSVDP